MSEINSRSGEQPENRQSFDKLYREKATMAGCAPDLVMDLWILLRPRCLQRRKAGTSQNDKKERTTIFRLNVDYMAIYIYICELIFRSGIRLRSFFKAKQ